MKQLFFSLILVSNFVFVLQGQELPPEVIRYADMIFYNAKVLTMDRDETNFTITEAVAIRDGRIMAAGQSQRILRMAGPQTQKVDLEGRTLMPGVIDTHSHPDNYSQRHFQGDFRAQLLALDLYKTAHISMMEWNDRQEALGGCAAGKL